MVITEERLEKALRLIAQTDAEVAGWKSMVLRTEFMAKSAEALVYKALSEGTVEDKKMAVRLAPETHKAWDEHFKAVSEYEKLKAFREREYIVIELYRTMSANQRKGNI